MPSIITNGRTFHGRSVRRLGVFNNNRIGRTYAGQHNDGYACGLAVTTWWSDGHKEYAEFGPDGNEHGRYLDRLAHGATNYCMQECGERKDYAYVSASGRCCEYNGVACAPDDPRFLALIEQVAPVEVRPAAAARQPQSPNSRSQAIVRCAGSFCTRRSSRTPWRPRCTPTARRRWWPRETTQQQPHCTAAARPRRDA